MSMCGKCTKVTGILLLVVGLLFLLQDLGSWDFWGISWWTALFLVVGTVKLASSHCAECQSCCAPAPSGKKKKR